MDIVGLLVSVVGCVSPHLSKRWEYHKNINKYLEDFRDACEKLNSRKIDIQRKLDAKIIEGVTEEANDVRIWLDHFAKISLEIEDTEKKVKDIKFFSRYKRGRRVFEMVEKIEKLYQEGAFSNEELVRELPQRGLALPTTIILEEESTSHKKREEIWASLLDEKVLKIGVYGMGGIGKTTALEHINNLLLKESDKFDYVIFITVSKASSILMLQEKIAHKLNMGMLNNDDEETKAAKIHKKLTESKRYVIILDDLWEAYSLKRVGIPEPTSDNGCKMVLTTRSRDVCSKMGCESIIEMGLLSEVEALNLFYKSVGDRVLSNQKLEKLVNQVAQECGRLPLAIVTVAGSLRDKVDHNYWITALDDLKDATASVSNEITTILRFSYDRLKDKKLQDCLVYCALYPEDYPIQRDLLIDQLIAEGIVDETRPHPTERGQAMLNDLVSVCLMIDAVDRFDVNCVKLHDLIRDMAIQIMRENPGRFLAKAGEELESLPTEENWNEDTEKASLMRNKIVEIPSTTTTPKCPKISTLFLNQNYRLNSIPELFFQQMEGLHVLDLSSTRIKELPKSVSFLVNLSVLLLKNCYNLEHVPSLSKLRNMRRLDFNHTGIREVPHGIENMIKLTYLNLSHTKLSFIPKGILCNLINLQYLSLFNTGEPISVSTEELESLRKLQTLIFTFSEFNDFNAYTRSLKEGSLTNFLLRVGYMFEDIFDSKIRVPNVVKLADCDIVEVAKAGVFPLSIPKLVEVLIMWSCQIKRKSLCKLTSTENLTSLSRLDISDCPVLEYLFYYSPTIFPLLQGIEEVSLGSLPDLREFFGMERGTLPPLSPGSFSSLKRLFISYCGNVIRLFIMNDASFPNLETISISYCEKLEEIVSTVNDNNTVTLPKLKVLHLTGLHKLQSIPFVADSLLDFQLHRCPQLKRIPFLDREPRHPSLQRINIGEETWNSLEWENLNDKAVYESMFPPRYNLQEVAGGGFENEEIDEDKDEEEDEEDDMEDVDEDDNEDKDEEEDEDDDMEDVDEDDNEDKDEDDEDGDITIGFSPSSTNI